MDWEDGSDGVRRAIFHFGPERNRDGTAGYDSKLPKAAAEKIFSLATPIPYSPDQRIDDLYQKLTRRPTVTLDMLCPPSSLKPRLSGKVDLLIASLNKDQFLFKTDDRNPHGRGQLDGQSAGKRSGPFETGFLVNTPSCSETGITLALDLAATTSFPQPETADHPLYLYFIHPLILKENPVLIDTSLEQKGLISINCSIPRNLVRSAIKYNGERIAEVFINDKVLVPQNIKR